jgi:hypothetical protein
MKVKYNREVDILSVWLSDELFDYAEEANGIITHFTKDARPVMLEIQGAKDFILGSVTILVKDEEVGVP